MTMRTLAPARTAPAFALFAGLALSACSLPAGDVDRASGDPTSSADETTALAARRPRPVKYSPIALKKTTLALLADCAALQPAAGDAFYCPRIDRYGFNRRVTPEVLAVLIQARVSSSEAARTADLDGAVQTLRHRADPQIATVGDAPTRAALEAIMNRYEGFLRGVHASRYVVTKGYWAPSVNSDSVYVVDDTNDTVYVVEHGDTDG